MLSFFLFHSLPLSLSLDRLLSSESYHTVTIAWKANHFVKFAILEYLAGSHCIVCVCVHIENEKRINATFIYFKGWTGILTD